MVDTGRCPLDVWSRGGAGPVPSPTARTARYAVREGPARTSGAAPAPRGIGGSGRDGGQLGLEVGEQRVLDAAREAVGQVRGPLDR